MGTKSPPFCARSYLQLIHASKWKSSFFSVECHWVSSIAWARPMANGNWPTDNTHHVSLYPFCFALLQFGTYCLTVFFFFLDLFLFQFCGVSFLRVKDYKVGWVDSWGGVIREIKEYDQKGVMYKIILNNLKIDIMCKVSHLKQLWPKVPHLVSPFGVIGGQLADLRFNALSPWGCRFCLSWGSNEGEKSVILLLSMFMSPPDLYDNLFCLFRASSILRLCQNTR